MPTSNRRLSNKDRNLLRQYVEMRRALIYSISLDILHKLWQENPNPVSLMDLVALDSCLGDRYNPHELAPFWELKKERYIRCFRAADKPADRTYVLRPLTRDMFDLMAALTQADPI